MVDALIGKLNGKIASQVKSAAVPGEAEVGKKFDQVLAEKRTSQLESLGKLIAEEKGSDMQVTSGENIQIKVGDVETGVKTEFSPKERFFSLFEQLNNDMVSMDSAIEVLSNPNTKFTRQQLLGYQYAHGMLTTSVELISRTAQTLVTTVRGIVEVQI